MSGTNEIDKQPGRVQDVDDNQRHNRIYEDHTIHYLVNGERQRAEKDILTVEEILRHAGSAAGIDVNDLDNYYLESISDERQYRNLADEVKLEDGDQFLAVYSGRTPVA